MAFTCARDWWTGSTRSSVGHRSPNGLAPREIETLQLIAQGFTYAQIATMMGLSQATVDTYAKRIRNKLNVTDKAEITRIVVELGHLVEERFTKPAA